KMEDKVGLTLACLNLKKLVKRMAGEPFYFVQMRWFKHGNSHFDLKTLKKTNTKSMFVFNLKSSVLLMTCNNNTCVRGTI
ncbi:IS5/IS1182 family transposase, partial [Streptococcus dysgalactiae subsp. equisimilis]